MEIGYEDMVFIKLSDTDKQNLGDLSEMGYVFDWSVFSSETSQTVAFETNGDLAGLVEFERQPANLLNYLWLIEVSNDYKGTGVAGMLLAYVAKDSLDAGYEGFVLFESKTVLIDYYIEKYGAKVLRAKQRLLFFDTEASLNLVNKYLEGVE